MPQDFPDHTPLGARIRLLGYTLGEVAAGARVNRWHLNDYLHERRTIIPMHLARLSAFLKCPPELLIDPPQPPQPPTRH